MKKILLFLTVILVISISGCKKNDNSNKKDNLNSVTIKGYTIKMDAEIIDKDKDGGYLKKEFTIVDEDKYTNTYSLILTDIYTDDDFDGDIIYDYIFPGEDDIAAPYGELNIDGKEFDYYLNSDVFTSTFVYYYGDDFSLEFKVYGVSVYTENGDQIKTIPDVDEDVLNSKEFAEILKFEVKKN